MISFLPGRQAHYKLANDGQDTRAIQEYLGHRSIVSTQRYTALSLVGFASSGKIEQNGRFR
jgi:site-specific recombinase XerC